MTQIAIIQAAPKSNPADKTLASDTPPQFSPHLEKAIAKATQDASTTSSIKSNPTKDQTAIDSPSLEAAEPLLEKIALKEPDHIPAKDFFRQNLSEVIEPVSTSNTGSGKFVNNDKELIVLLEPMGAKELSPETSGKEPPVLSEINEQKISPSQILTEELPALSEPDKQKEQAPQTVVKELPVLVEFNRPKELSPQVLDKELAVSSSQNEPKVQPPYTAGQESSALSKLFGQKGLPPEALARELPVAAIHIDQKSLSRPNVSEAAAIQPVTKEFLQLSPEKIAVHHSSPAPVKTSNTPIEIDIAATLPRNNVTPVSTMVLNQTLLQQLQQITMGNEIQTISIQATVTTDSLQNPGEIGTKPGWLMASQIIEQGAATEKPVSKTPSLRQDMLAQYFDTKINGGEKTDSGQNTQNGDQQSSTNGQQSSTILQSNSPLSPEQPGSFQHISTLIPDMQASQIQTGIKPIILPSGTVVHEDNVIQQIVERFQINNRANGTKLSLQLHPEELGELKIDLTLKEGSIKANVVAQSQHVREIIERNMIKLRNVLEDKGFTVEDIVVTSESDSVPDFDLFEQNFSQQNDFSVPTSKVQNQNGFDTILEEAVEQSIGLTTGVNIIA